MSHRTLGRPGAVAVAGALALLLAACSSTSSTSAPPAPTSTGAGVPLVGAPLTVPDGLDDAPFDEPREVRVPDGWSVSLWARVDAARLAAWTPDDRLLVSRPKQGDVVLLTPGDAEPVTTTLLSGLDQPHRLAFVLRHRRLRGRGLQDGAPRRLSRVVRSGGGPGRHSF